MSEDGLVPRKWATKEAQLAEKLSPEMSIAHCGLQAQWLMVPAHAVKPTFCRHGSEQRAGFALLSTTERLHTVKSVLQTDSGSEEQVTLSWVTEHSSDVKGNGFCVIQAHPE